MHPLQYVKAMEMWNDGVSGKEIAAALGLSKKVIYQTAHNHREDFPRRVHVTPPEWLDEAIEMRERGMTCKEISKIVGLGEQNVRVWLNDAGMA